MRLRTRVLSFMLAGSMMLSATPVSAFAQTNHTESPISTIADISNDQSILTASASNQTYTMPMMVAADNVTFTNCTFEQSVSVAGNNVQFINCIVKSFESVPLSVATLKDYIALLQSQGYSYTVSDFSAIANPEAASLVLNGGTYDNYICGLSGTLTITGNGTFTNKIAIVNSDTTIENGTFTGPVAALSESSSQYTGVLNITGGVFAKEPQGATGSIYKLSAEGASINDMASPVYIANQTAVPHIEMTYPANSAHKVIAWRFDIDNSNNQHGNSDATDPRAAVLLAQANYQNSADNRTIRFDCVPSIKYNGYTMGALNADTVFTPVLDVLPSELTFHAATENGPASVELGADMPADRIDISCFYTNVATNEVSEEYPTEAGTYQISVILKAKGLSDELKNNIYQNRVEWNGAYHQLSYANESTGNTLTSLTSENWRFQISTNTVTLTVDENGAPVIPADAKGVHYEGNTLTIDEHTTAQFAQGSTVKCDIVNNGTLDGGLFTGTVTGSGSIARGLFLHDPKTSLPTMMLSVPENASLNGITKPDATGLTTLYAINTLSGENNKLLFIGDYIGTDPHTFYGWDLVYSFGGEEKNSGVDYIRQTHFEQPMYGPIPNDQNGVNCTFLPVLEMDASDLTITADKAESKIDGAVIESVQYVDESDPNAALSSVYPTKAGKYKAIVTLACPGDSTYYKNRVARIGNLCYHVPEKLEVPFTVDSEPVPVVPPTDGDGNVTIEGTDEVKGDGWTAKKDDEGKTTVTITGDKDFKDTTLNCDKITIGSEGTNTTISNITTNAEVTVASGSTIEGGTFSGNVSGEGTIEGGTFTGTVDSSVTVTGGVFANEPTNIAASKAKVTVTGGATVNNLKNDGNDGNRNSTVTVVTGKEQTIQLSAEVADHDLIGWKETVDDGSDPTLNRDSSITINQNDATERTFTPVVQAIRSDLAMLDVSTGSEEKYYLLGADGNPTGEGFDVLPEDAGIYAKCVKLTLPTINDEVNSIALYAADVTLDRVLEKDGIGYYVPKLLQVGDSITVGSPDAATGSGDSGAGGAAVAVIGGAAIGGAAYLIGTQVYLTSVLPEGASIPTNRQQLADLLWTAAGKPQPASTALFTDISAEAADSQKAARWCVEQGLLKDTGSTFKPDKHTFRPQVIKAWNDLQAKLNPQK